MDEEGALAEGPHNLEKLGMTVQNLTPELAHQFGLDGEKGSRCNRCRAGIGGGPREYQAWWDDSGSESPAD